MLISHACEILACEEHVKSVWKPCEKRVTNVILFTCFFTCNFTYYFTHFFLNSLPEANMWKTMWKPVNFHTIFIWFSQHFTHFSHAYFTCVWNVKGRELCAIPLHQEPGQTRVDQGQSLAWKLACSRALAISGWLRDQKKVRGKLQPLCQPAAGLAWPWRGSIKMWEIGQGESKTTLVSLAIY